MPGGLPGARSCTGGWRGRTVLSAPPFLPVAWRHTKQCCWQGLPQAPHPSDWQRLSNDQPRRGLANLLPWNIFEVSQKMTQQPPKPDFFLCIPYKGIFGCLGVNPPPPCTRQRYKYTTRQHTQKHGLMTLYSGALVTLRRQATELLLSPHPLPHPHTSVPSLSQAHNHTHNYIDAPQHSHNSQPANQPQQHHHHSHNPSPDHSHLPTYPLTERAPHSHQSHVDTTVPQSPSPQCTHNHVRAHSQQAYRSQHTGPQSGFHRGRPPPPLTQASLIKHISPSACYSAWHSSAIESKTSPDRGAKWKEKHQGEGAARGPGLGGSHFQLRDPDNL